ncbi:MAG TPA: hypothetical protein VJZ71_02440 [Phycisphaerae bacterium]|nr:hypothetical protein [Phycisphaerae bacterium]
MEHAVDTLNRLLDAESSSLVHRLSESNPFVTWPAAADRAVVERIVADVGRHRRELVEMILTLRGAAVPPRYPSSMGGVHYLKLSYLMPQVITSVRELVKTYESAGSTGRPQADALIARLLADYQRHLAELEKMHANLAQPAA